jgi:hypothetical protein
VFRSGPLQAARSQDFEDGARVVVLHRPPGGRRSDSGGTRGRRAQRTPDVLLGALQCLLGGLQLDPELRLPPTRFLQSDFEFLYALFVRPTLACKCFHLRGPERIVASQFEKPIDHGSPELFIRQSRCSFCGTTGEHRLRIGERDCVGRKNLNNRVATAAATLNNFDSACFLKKLYRFCASNGVKTCGGGHFPEAAFETIVLGRILYSVQQTIGKLMKISSGQDDPAFYTTTEPAPCANAISRGRAEINP